MAVLRWNACCAIDVPEIDQQHGVLLDAMNEVLQALKHGIAARGVQQAIYRLAALARLHCVSEDRLLAQYNFPELSEHRAEHQRLLQQLAIFDGSSATRQASQSGEFVAFLESWFREHTELAARVYGPWLHSHGVGDRVSA